MSSRQVDLKLDWCSHRAAKFAVERWHYSRRMPKSKLAKLGVWENGDFIGVVIFGSGATPDLVKKYGLTQFQACELVRVALTKHATPVSKIVSISIKLLRKEFTGLRLVISFADPKEGHLGKIYQAMGWIYTGMSAGATGYYFKGREWHTRAFNSTIGALHNKKNETHFEYAKKIDPNVRKTTINSKFRYLYPLDKEMRQQIESLAKPYPKSLTSIDGDAPHKSSEKKRVQVPA